MFGRREHTTPLGVKDDTEKASLFRVATIPDAYYGGNNPEIYAPTPAVSQPSRDHKGVGPVSPNTVSERSSVRGGGGEALFQKRWFRIGLVVFSFLVALGLISWYYIRQAFPSSPVSQTPPPRTQTNTIPTNNPPTTQAPSVSTVTSSVANTTTTQPGGGDRIAALEFPSSLLTDAADTDSDTLTDGEEELYATDSGTWDTDGDGFFDGREVTNLYSPSEKSPVRLIDSGRVKDYINPTFGFRLYYPIAWQVASVDTASHDVLFSSPLGDFVEVLTTPKEGGATTITDWFGTNAKGQRITDYSSFSNRFTFAGMKRADNLVALYETKTAIVTFVYHPGISGLVSFRSTFIMMFQSFRTGGVSQDLPVQDVIPTEGVSATRGR